MRTTRSMMVENSIYYISKQADRLADAQVKTSTGKQINKPSDDPTAARRLLRDRVTLSQYGQYESNISQAMNWIETSETTLDSISSFLEQGKELLSTLSSGGTSSTEDYKNELETIYDQVISLANSRYGSGFMYGGSSDIQTAPFSNTVAVSSGAAENILFDMAEDATSVTIEVTDSSGNVVRTLAVYGGTAGTNSIAWDGLDGNGNSLEEGVYDFTICANDSSGNVVAVFPSYRGSEKEKKVITGQNSLTCLNNNGGEIFSDALSVLSQAITAIKNGEDEDVFSNLNQDLQAVVDNITMVRTTQANVNSQLESCENRLETLSTSLESQISEVETGSSEEEAVKLQAQETAYEEVIKVTSEILKLPKLADYL